MESQWAVSQYYHRTMNLDTLPIQILGRTLLWMNESEQDNFRFSASTLDKNGVARYPFICCEWAVKELLVSLLEYRGYETSTLRELPIIVSSKQIALIRGEVEKVRDIIRERAHGKQDFAISTACGLVLKILDDTETPDAYVILEHFDHLMSAAVIVRSAEGDREVLNEQVAHLLVGFGMLRMN